MDLSVSNQQEMAAPDVIPSPRGWCYGREGLGEGKGCQFKGATLCGTTTDFATSPPPLPFYCCPNKLGMPLAGVSADAH